MNIFREFFTSVVRTLVPAIVGIVMSFLATTSLPVDPQFEIHLAGVLAVLFNAVYYMTARFLETKYSDKFGWLLGLASSPAYKQPITVTKVNEHSEAYFASDGKG
jgi:hypothetical protein